MMKKFICVLLLIVSSVSFAQISANDLVGNWKVVKVLNKTGNKELTEGLKTATFTFDKNFDFTLKSSHPNNLLSQLETMTKNTKWKMDFQKKRVKIGTKNDNYSTMFIVISKVKGKIIFHVQESNINLEVEKL